MTIVGGGGQGDRYSRSGTRESSSCPCFFFWRGYFFPFFALLTLSGRDGGIISFFQLRASRLN